MDDRRFDQLARALGGASTRRRALAALAGIAAGLGAAGKDAEAKKGRRKCDPACPAGQTCRQGACTCDNGGTVCGASCCADGQTCQSGTCADPLPQCLAFGASCKNAGVPCCDGTVCASGQGGTGDIACYRPAGAACATTAECVFDSTCKDGVCVANPQPQPQPACVPSFPVTGDAAANGRALQAAWDAAKTASGTVITLAPGTYDLPPSGEGYAMNWSSGEVTLQGCAGEVRLNGRGTRPFALLGGIVTLKGLILDGAIGADRVSDFGVTASLSASVTLDECTLTGFTQRGVQAGQSANVTLLGGTYWPNGQNGDASLKIDTFQLAAAAFTCSGNPSVKLCDNLGAAFASCGCTGNG